MLSLDSKKRSTSANKGEKHGGNTTTITKKLYYFPRIDCFSSPASGTPADRKSGSSLKSLEVEADNAGERQFPAHLVIMVHGIIGSSGNWRYAAKQFVRRFPSDIIVHCSECNSSTLTFDGVDVMGERLAEEVKSVIRHKPGVEKISFVGHSLGGLVIRYAIGRLYEQNLEKGTTEMNGGSRNFDSEAHCIKENCKGKVAGLEPMNFITFATPHLGSKGHKQLPFACGFSILEKVASCTSHWIVGRTGKHLFLNDNDDGHPPLLLQMVNDCGDLKFISALQSFNRRVAYSNATFDHIVGWRSSSIRRKQELPKRKLLSRDKKYPHIVNVEMKMPESVQLEDLSEVKDKAVALEEAMIRGLMKVSWERIDVCFRNSTQRFFAHSTIQVKTFCINSDGADVIFHMIDNFLV